MRNLHPHRVPGGDPNPPSAVDSVSTWRLRSRAGRAPASRPHSPSPVTEPRPQPAEETGSASLPPASGGGLSKLRVFCRGRPGLASHSSDKSTRRESTRQRTRACETQRDQEGTGEREGARVSGADDPPRCAPRWSLGKPDPPHRGGVVSRRQPSACQSAGARRAAQGRPAPWDTRDPPGEERGAARPASGGAAPGWWSSRAPGQPALVPRAAGRPAAPPPAWSPSPAP